MPTENPVDNIEDYIVQIDADGQRGTGILIAPNWILTCVHVIRLDLGIGEEAERINISWDGNLIEAELVHATQYPFPDIALLKATIDNDKYISFGSDPIASGTGSEGFYFGGFPMGLTLDQGSLTYDGQLERLENPHLKFKNSLVHEGTSGGPILLKSNGTLCAMMVENRSQDYDAGGLGIPVSIIMEELKKVDQFDFKTIKVIIDTPDNLDNSNQENNVSSKKDFQIMISKGDIKDALEALSHFFDKIKNDKAHMMTIQLSARFNRNERDNQMGILGTENYNLERNKIASSLLYLVQNEL